MDGKLQHEGETLLFGWRSVTPTCIQKLNRPVAFLVFMTCTSVFQSLTCTGLVGVVLSSLEKRFDFSSAQSSWIASAYDASTVIVIIIICHWGARGHRPKLTAIGLFIMAMGSFIFIIPHMATSVYKADMELKGNNLCRNRTGEDMCDDDHEGSGGWLALFIFGRVLHGIGATPLGTIAVTFMDDTVPKETFSLYIAIFMAGSVLGPALAYVLGGYILSALYTDFISIDPASIGLSSDDPRWVGAWWLLFVLSAIVICLLVIPMSGYPRDLPGAAEVRAKKESEAYNARKEDEEDCLLTDGFGKSFTRHIKQLVTNPTYIFLTLFICCHATLIAGFATFGPKYVETQFSASAGLAGMIFGLMVVPAGAGGPVVGGIIIKRFKISCTGIMKMEAIMSAVILMCTLVFFNTCQQVKFAGVNVGYNSSSPITVEEGNITDVCNVDCMCKDVPYDPTCSIDNVQYFSPCHGACTEMTGINTKSYFNCSCITTNVSLLYRAHATSEPCTSPDCHSMPAFIGIFFIALVFVFATEGIHASSVMRSVPGPQRALALALAGIVGRTLGTIPAPIVFGEIFDSTCLKWSERCGKRGSCIFYDNQRLASYMFLTCLIVLALALLFITLALKLYKPPNINDTVIDININGDKPIATISKTENVNGIYYTNSEFPGYMPHKKHQCENGHVQIENTLPSYEEVTLSNMGENRGWTKHGYEYTQDPRSSYATRL